MRNITLLIIMILLTLCGCQKHKTADLPEPENETEAYLLNLPEKPSENDPYFLITNGGLINEDIWNDFVDRCRQGEAAEITFGQYTIEGDVIYSFLSCDGDHYVVTTDNSRDQYGKPQFYREERKYLNYFEWMTNEEYSDGFHPARNRVACLSEEVYTEAENLMEKLREGDPDIVILWGDQSRADK